MDGPHDWGKRGGLGANNTLSYMAPPVKVEGNILPLFVNVFTSRKQENNNILSLDDGFGSVYTSQQLD